VNRGNAYLTLARYKDAMDDYDRAIILSLHDWRVYLNRGFVKMKYELNADAIIDFDKSI
jgi:tetratricopeptide (TPR) repeat protein